MSRGARPFFDERNLGPIQGIEQEMLRPTPSAAVTLYDQNVAARYVVVSPLK